MAFVSRPLAAAMGRGGANRSAVRPARSAPMQPVPPARCPQSTRPASQALAQGGLRKKPPDLQGVAKEAVAAEQRHRRKARFAQGQQPNPPTVATMSLCRVLGAGRFGTAASSTRAPRAVRLSKRVQVLCTFWTAIHFISTNLRTAPNAPACNRHKYTPEAIDLPTWSRPSHTAR